MKKVILFAVAPLIAAGSLIGQLNFTGPTNLDPHSDGNPYASVWQGLVAGMHDVHAPDISGPAINNNNVVELKFSFDFDIVTNRFENPSFTRYESLSGESTGLDQILYRRLDVNFERFVASGDFRIGFFGFDAAATNTIGAELFPLDGNDRFDLFKYNQSPDPEVGPPPSYYDADIGQSLEEVFSIFHTAEFSSSFRESYQENRDFWRIYEAQDYEAFSGIEGLNGYVILLDDFFPRFQDWDDAFIVMEGFVTAVPEPSTVALLAVVGLVGIVYFRRRRSTKGT